MSAQGEDEVEGTQDEYSLEPFGLPLSQLPGICKLPENNSRCNVPLSQKIPLYPVVCYAGTGFKNRFVCFIVGKKSRKDVIRNPVCLSTYFNTRSSEQILTD